MGDYFNLTNVSASADYLEFTQNTNTALLGGALGVFIVLIIFCVMFLAVKSRGYYTSASFAVACWMCTLTALLLKPMNLISDPIWWTCLMLTPIAIITLIIVGAGQ